MQRQRLTSALLKQLLIVGVISIGITLLFVVTLLIPQLKQDLARQQQTVAKILANQSYQKIRIAEDEIQFLKRSLHSGSSLTLNQHIEYFLGSSSLFDAIYLLNGDNLITEISAANLDAALADSLYHGADLSKNPLLKQRPKDSQPFWSNTFLSLVTARASIAYVSPFNGGLLVAEIAISRIPQLEQPNASDELLFMILDQHANLIAHPEHELSDQHLNLGNLPFFKDQHVSQTRSEYFEWQGQSYFGTAVWLDKLDWTFIVAQEEGSFSRGLARTLKAWLATIALIFLAAMLLSYYRARAFSNHFGKLSLQAHKVALGEYQSEIEASPIVEINDLAQSIYQMVDAIEKRELSLTTKEAQLRDTLEGTPNVAIQWFDEKNRVCYWNAASQELFGFCGEEAKGKRLEHLILAPREAAEFNNCMNKVRQEKHCNQSFELNFHDNSGKPGEIIGSIFCIPNPEGAPITVCMAVDITLQRRAENHIRRLNLELEHRVEARTAELQKSNLELNNALDNLNATMTQLVQSEKLAALGSLVAGIAHELNTPIGNALMAATTLQDFAREMRHQVETGTIRKSAFEAFLDDANSAAQITRRNLEKASELITSFKQVAVDQSSSQRRKFGLLELVDEILMTLRPVLRRSSIEIKVDVDPEISMDSYPGPLGQILSNLINNALIHAFDEGMPGEIHITATLANQQIMLVVRDNGKGITSDHLPKLFEPFFTTRQGRGGCGLGLHIVHNLATELLGGRIRVDSELGKGTTFTLMLDQSTYSEQDASTGFANQRAI